MTVYNSISKLAKRTVGELEGLNIINLETSFKSRGTRIDGFEIIRPTKIYKNKIKVIRRYENKVRH